MFITIHYFLSHLCNSNKEVVFLKFRKLKIYLISNQNFYLNFALIKQTHQVTDLGCAFLRYANKSPTEGFSASESC